MRGQPGEEDIAALLAVLLALRTGGGGRAGRAPPDVSGRWRGPGAARVSPRGPR
ncbi:acyl-CoA carboxylase epsilon subunit [Streptomyces erythrogriseus]